jgi:tetratricopeptide (TPR) repeat protein
MAFEPCSFAAGAKVSDEISELSNQGKNAYQMGDYAEARKYYNQALSKVQKDPSLDKIQAAILGDLGTVDYALRDYPASKLHFLDSLELKKNYTGSSDRASMIATIDNLIRVCRKLGDERGAREMEDLSHRLQTPRGPTAGLRAAVRPVSKSERITGVKTGIRQIIALSDADREYLLNPTIGERDVLDHYEHRTGYRRDDYGIEHPYDIKVPIYRHEKYKASKDDDLEFIKAISDLENRFGTSMAGAKTTVISGGAVIELENGMVFQTARGMIAKGWSTGDDVILQEHPSFEFPAVVLVHGNTGKSLGGEVIANH